MDKTKDMSKTEGLGKGQGQKELCISVAPLVRICGAPVIQRLGSHRDSRHWEGLETEI